MHGLTVSCSGLFTTLFTPSIDKVSIADEEYVSRIKQKILNEQKPLSICFLIRPRMHVPWGLVFDGPPVSAEVPSQVRQDSFVPGTDFQAWCAGFSVTALTRRI